MRVTSTVCEVYERNTDDCRELWASVVCPARDEHQRKPRILSKNERLVHSSIFKKGKRRNRALWTTYILRAPAASTCDSNWLRPLLIFFLFFSFLALGFIRIKTLPLGLYQTAQKNETHRLNNNWCNYLIHQSKFNCENLASSS